MEVLFPHQSRACDLSSTAGSLLTQRIIASKLAISPQDLVSSLVLHISS